MAEWSIAVVLKTTEAARSPGVRIPLPPPDANQQLFIDIIDPGEVPEWTIGAAC